MTAVLIQMVQSVFVMSGYLFVAMVCQDSIRQAVFLLAELYTDHFCSA